VTTDAPAPAAEPARSGDGSSTADPGSSTPESVAVATATEPAVARDDSAFGGTGDNA
jgi:hypothetical protein